jgi:Type I phosphodiesterase / nucleotide pyrophosphatase
MPLDDLALRLQRNLDRLVRRLRAGPPPPPGRRLLIVQIDGLSRSVLEDALAHGRMPFLARLLKREGYRSLPMSVGLPTSTPAFQLAAMYGVRPDIPGFHFHDKRRRADVYFPRGGDAALVEERQARGRLGILHEGSAYGCVFTGGAANSLFSLARMKRPTGQGLVRAVSAVVVLAWVVVKGVALTGLELARAGLRFLADPVGESARGWKRLAIKLGISVWLRELFTLAVSRDLYAGVPAVYVNYLDYDVFAHTFGPRHRRALRALAGVDRALRQLWRVCRRVPEHGYDLYVLSDHGQAPCTPYRGLTGGRPLERVLFEEYLRPTEVTTNGAAEGTPRRVRTGLAAYRRACPGVLQRFLNYLEDDFPWAVGELRESREHDGVRVISAGPNAFVYFLEEASGVGVEWIDGRFPGLVDAIANGTGIGFVLVRSKDGPVCLWRGKRYHLGEVGSGPFEGRPDLALVTEGIRELMGMPSAGDLVIYGLDAREGHVSYVGDEAGAHAGPTPEEMHTFLIVPPGASPPPVLTHPVQLYDYFVRYGTAGAS